MSYWELETELWELVPDDYDGARTMTLRGRIDLLERSYNMENKDTE